MRYSQLFGKTSKTEVAGSDLVSHQMLIRGGFIRESVAGRYFFLPLGWRVHEKIKAIIKEEMDAVGAQEMLSPVLHPLELWQETNRTNTAGFELMKVADRRGAEFALGGTAEEMFVDVVRKFQLSHRDLPFVLYQFSTKFRDEMRARGGLLRVREFVMKDAYSFDRDKQAFEKIYEAMARAYERIFSRMGLEAVKVAADNGYIGGEYCHEFVVESEVGESRYFVSEDGAYVAHEDVASIQLELKNPDENMQEYEEVEAVRGTTMEDGVKLHGLPIWQQLKNVAYVDKEGTLYLVVIRGDLDVNKTKLEHVLDRVGQLEMANEEQIRAVGSEPGFLSPVGMENKAKIIADLSVKTVTNFYSGANHLHLDAKNINYQRDFKASLEADVAMAHEGMLSPTGSALREKRGIEVGNIFQLGFHYTRLMKDASFITEQGSPTPYYMGCYGIGLGRTMATIVEKFHDERGIVWPKAVAPFQIQLISLQGQEVRAEKVYKQLASKGFEVLWDDRDVSPGVKFADADLLGMPVRLVVSSRQPEKLEWKQRDSSEVELLTVEEIISRIMSE